MRLLRLYSPFSKTVLILGRSTVPMKLPELAIQKSIPMSDQRRVWRTKAVLMSDLFAPSVKLSSLGTGDCALVLSSGTWLNSLLYAADFVGSFSATAVGIAMGSGSLAGVLGHFLGGYLGTLPPMGAS